jgi:hypothetical protein
MNINDVISYLIRISEAKAKLMKDILDITQKQSFNIDEEHINVLTNLIQQKQKCIDKVNILNSEFTEKYNYIKKNLSIDSLDEISTLEYPQIINLQAIIKNMDKIVEEIKYIDEKNNKAMMNALEVIKNELRKIKNSRKINVAYHIDMPLYNGIFIDKKK